MKSLPDTNWMSIKIGADNSVIDRFLLSQDVKDSSRYSYRRSLKQFIIWVHENHINQPTRIDIITYKKYLKDKGLGAYTISNYLVVVRKFFQWLESEKIYPNVAKGIKGANYKKKIKKDVLSVTQIKRLLKAVEKDDLQGKRDFAIINLLVRTGLRTVEIVRANVTDIQLRSDREAMLWIQGKGRDEKDEFVLLTEPVLRPINQYLERKGVSRNNEPLFTSVSDRNYGNRLTTRSISRIVKKHLRKIGLDSRRLSAHSLRHTFGVVSLENGASLYDVQLAMRHADPGTTEIYLKTIEDKRKVEKSPTRIIDSVLS